MIWKVEFSCGICGNFSGSFIFTWTLARSLNRDLHQNSTLEKIQKVLSQHLDHVTGSDQGSQSCFKSEVQIEKWLTEVIGHSAPHFAHTADVRWGSLWGECHRHETLLTIHPGPDGAGRPGPSCIKRSQQECVSSWLVFPPPSWVLGGGHYHYSRNPPAITSQYLFYTVSLSDNFSVISKLAIE